MNRIYISDVSVPTREQTFVLYHTKDKMKRDFMLFRRIFDNSTIWINKRCFSRSAYELLLYPTNGTEQKDSDKDGKQTHKGGHK